MAENFVNYYGRTTSMGTEKAIVPNGLTGSNTSLINVDSSWGANVRTINSIVQVHSLYITQVFATRPTGANRYDEKNFRNFDLFIKDSNQPNLKIHIAHDVQLVPGCPFYIEKNITLAPSQSLCILLPGVSPNTNGGLDVQYVASSIEFVSDDDIMYTQAFNLGQPRPTVQTAPQFNAPQQAVHDRTPTTGESKGPTTEPGLEGGLRSRPNTNTI